MTRRRFYILFMLTPTIILAGTNYTRLETYARDVGKQRAYVSPHAYYRYGIDPNNIVFDLWGITEDASGAGVIGGLFQFAEKLKDREFSYVYLAYHGEVRFRIAGREFKEIGETFAWQNPVYLIRTLPEKLETPSGQHAFDTWTGGALGVLSAQMNDVNSFTRRWWMNDEIGRHH